MQLPVRTVVSSRSLVFFQDCFTPFFLSKLKHCLSYAICSKKSLSFGAIAGYRMALHADPTANAKANARTHSMSKNRSPAGVCMRRSTKTKVFPCTRRMKSRGKRSSARTPASVSLCLFLNIITFVTFHLADTDYVEPGNRAYSVTLIEKSLYLDASRRRNIGGSINHSHEPNAKLFVVRYLKRL